ncbi:hypothetical protein BD324DRAFT_651193 [Kockovaella imperatae]|uniref:Uncharacterized protein n=1 Tax=Kockovaella imperatae TaxID=4999 RepID=A0A1Y1UFA3_9TREE|nr:hypothetical protein BD324DRAFT_651193 [Kockovaella imperatae]ORX36708.1 hypothetical protein BD324DRAFT_651193 [Kockovaella imperatae]
MLTRSKKRTAEFQLTREDSVSPVAATAQEAEGSGTRASLEPVEGREVRPLPRAQEALITARGLKRGASVQITKDTPEETATEEPETPVVSTREVEGREVRPLPRRTRKTDNANGMITLNVNTLRTLSSRLEANSQADISELLLDLTKAYKIGLRAVRARKSPESSNSEDEEGNAMAGPSNSVDNGVESNIRALYPSTPQRLTGPTERPETPAGPSNIHEPPSTDATATSTGLPQTPQATQPAEEELTEAQAAALEDELWGGPPEIPPPYNEAGGEANAVQLQAAAPPDPPRHGTNLERDIFNFNAQAGITDHDLLPVEYDIIRPNCTMRLLEVMTGLWQPMGTGVFKIQKRGNTRYLIFENLDHRWLMRYRMDRWFDIWNESPRGFTFVGKDLNERIGQYWIILDNAQNLARKLKHEHMLFKAGR